MGETNQEAGTTGHMPLPDNIISRESAERLTPVPFQFADIRALAARILKRAQEQADQKLAAARSQIAQLEKDAIAKARAEALPKAEKEGFAKGEEAGKIAAKAELAKEMEKEKAAFQQKTATVVAALEQVAAALTEHRQELMAQAEADLLLLSMDLARRLVGHELSVDAEAIRPLAHEAIGMVTQRTDLVVRLNPQDVASLEEELPSLKAVFNDLGAIRLQADPEIERGGLIVSTRDSEVDMLLATRFAAFEQALLGFSGPDAVAPWNKVQPPQENEAADKPVTDGQQ